eukprot:TRINITY_DN66197_c0_g1_i1.p1 TRINITY_DN66197_c0_g1~~TRINITY_DN66197_c0_g1_i1.p1  ORF type:complete len:123 (+),score=31.46 TRINITY_DN66197_c0_g1_i1:83-451(+)
MGAIERTITEKLTAAFAPTHLRVINESHMHNVPPGAETHFKVVVVSDAFEGVKLVERHRKVNGCLAEELQSGVHALSIQAKTPAQWAAGGGDGQPTEASPSCAGGDGEARRKHAQQQQQQGE